MLNIFWFRKDLRLTDNNGLSEFIKINSAENKFAFLYIKNKNTFRYYGKKRISFLLECLTDLKNELKFSGFDLQIIEGNSKDAFQNIISEHGKVSVYLNKQIEPYCIKRDSLVKDAVINSGGTFNSFTDTTVFTTGKIKNIKGQQYKIFTPFKNKFLKTLTPSDYKKIKCNLTSLKKENQVKLNPTGNLKILKNNTYNRSELLIGGRREGLRALKKFSKTVLIKYKLTRDFPSIKGTSFLSAHLHFGTIGIREAFRTAFMKMEKVSSEAERISVSAWITELIWREFYYNLTFNNPGITTHSFKKEFDNLKWSYDEEHFNKWCEGKTGFPIVDAGMRQLNSEGWMHNRLRMITAMFLTKDLFIDWRYGEKYFADKLIDLDFSNNNGGWQWSASTGADSQPYFRIFNPYIQSKKFDPDGIYIKKYLPELRSVPDKFIHQPDIMPAAEQKKFGVIIGKDYPAPVVDHNAAKMNAVKKFKTISKKSIGFKK